MNPSLHSTANLATRLLASGSLAIGLLATGLTGQGFDGAKLRSELGDKAAGFWIYDDLDSAYEKGKQTGKPLLVSFRCVP